MQDQQNTLGLIEPMEDAAVSQVGENPTRPADIYPLDLSSRSRDEVLLSAKQAGERRRNAWLAAAAFVAVFALGWAGGSNWHRFSTIASAFNPFIQKVTSSHRISDPEVKSAGKIDGPGRKATTASLQSPNTLTLSTPAASIPARPQNPSLGGAHPASAPSSMASSVVQANASLPDVSVALRETMVPAPETRPTTIEGWTVRDVRGNTVVLEGPGGVWTATQGDTVPGVGRIDSIVRWGSRWIVATASGLIATP